MFLSWRGFFQRRAGRWRPSTFLGSSTLSSSAGPPTSSDTRPRKSALRRTRPDRVWAPPCRELLLTDEVRARAAALAVEHPGLIEVLGKLAEGIAVEGMESLTPALIGGARMDLLTDLVPAGTHVLVCDPERVRSRAADLVRTAEEFLAASWATAGEAGGGPPAPAAPPFPPPGAAATPPPRRRPPRVSEGGSLPHSGG